MRASVVMRFTPTGADLSIEQTETRLAKYREHQIAHGFSKWIILDRGTNLPIGDSGLLVLKEYGWIDFAFRLALCSRRESTSTYNGCREQYHFCPYLHRARSAS